MQGISNSNVVLSYLTVVQDTNLHNVDITGKLSYPESERFPSILSFQKYLQNTIIVVPEKAVFLFIQCQGPGGNGGNGLCSLYDCSGGSGGGGGAYTENILSLHEIGHPKTLSLSVNQMDGGDTYVSHQPIGYLCYAGAGKNGLDGTDQINPNSNSQYVKGGNSGQGSQPVYESGGYANIGGYGSKGTDSFFQYGAGGGAGGGYSIDPLKNAQTAFYGGYGGAFLLNNFSSQINNNLRGTPGIPNQRFGTKGGGGCALSVNTITNDFSDQAGNGGDGLEGCGGGGGGSFGYLNDPIDTISNNFSIQKGLGGKGGKGYIKITFYS